MLTTRHQIELALSYVRTRLAERTGPLASTGTDWAAFSARLQEHFPVLIRELNTLYGERDDFLDFLVSLLAVAFENWRARPAELKALDAQRERRPDWFQSQGMVGGVCYVDLFAGNLQGIREQIPHFKELGLTYLHLMPLFRCPEGNSDGGYAVSSYREVNPALGTIDDLRQVAADLRHAGISLVVDFIFNHTSDEHQWARRCVAGDAAYRDFYYIFPDRQMPDAYDRTVREIFPDQHPGAFSQLPDARWVWTTFNSFQWDLNYANPAVFTAMAGELLAIANLGVEIVRMDAVAFIWKRLGTVCENLPEAHTVLRAFNAVARIAAPSLLFKSEAIVHPDDVVKYISLRECQLSYNPLQMALLWNTLATREVNLLQQALAERHAIEPGTAWVNYVRCHDDIGWTFADEDAIRTGIKGFDHRQFLNRFYVNRFAGSFARGVPFQDNPATGDCRISGMCASLTGLEQGDPLAVDRILLLHSVILSAGGIPLIYLGDEVGTLNDMSYLDDPHKAGDSRWVHRPPRHPDLYAARHDPTTASGRIYLGLRHLIGVRKHHDAFAGGDLTPFWSGNPSVLGYLRYGTAGPILVLANFSESPQHIEAHTFSALSPRATDLVTRETYRFAGGLTLKPYQFVWLV